MTSPIGALSLLEPAADECHPASAETGDEIVDGASPAGPDIKPTNNVGRFGNDPVLPITVGRERVDRDRFVTSARHIDRLPVENPIVGVDHLRRLVGVDVNDWNAQRRHRPVRHDRQIQTCRSVVEIEGRTPKATGYVSPMLRNVKKRPDVLTPVHASSGERQAEAGPVAYDLLGADGRQGRSIKHIHCARGFSSCYAEHLRRAPPARPRALAALQPLNQMSSFELAVVWRGVGHRPSRFIGLDEVRP